MRCTILLIMLFLSSCREKVYDDFPPFDKVPTVNSFLTRDSVIAVHVSMATKIEKGSIDGVDNAIVRVFSDNGVDMALLPEGDGWYKASLSVETGETYHCEVTVPGFSTVFSSPQIPSEPVFLNLQHIAIAGKDEEGTTYPAINFTFNNNPNEVAYYEVVIRLANSDKSAELLNIVDPVLLEEGLPIALFSNATITGNNYTMVLNYTTGSAGSTGVDGEWRTTLYPFVFELRKVSKSYYLHKRSLKLYETGRYPEFALGGNPVFNVYSNVENGYGIFAAYSSILSDTIYPSY
ncbi:MAG: DUF4249 domain-containing protein [Bacteroidales bacterium]|nr:DUF4249 domain-containing protein [Bacteroidales bacterium]